MNLVIVESPNKCKKIGSYLGPGYRVVATVGHFRDLPPRELAVDVATMRPSYQVDPKKRDVVARLRSTAAKASEILIASDPDREGEAIGWHVAQVLGLGSRAQRIVFHEITKAAVQKAARSPRPIDQELVDAQQARRLLDRLVGYKVSPLLRPLGSGLSAGRVQTATLHLVAQRERDRLAFTPKPYWVVRALYDNGMVAELCDEKGKPRRPETEREAATCVEMAKAASPHRVASVERSEGFKKPPPPFTTSTLQQVASTKLGIGPKRCMQIAQKLFEQGLITYHRSDSVALSDDAVDMARAWIAANHPNSLPDVAPKYRSKAGAQEAHEAIRTTSLDQVELSGDAPGTAPGTSKPEEAKLYDLIRTRFLASQFKPAVLSKTKVMLEADGQHFVARGTEVLEPHWLQLQDDPEEAENEGRGKDDSGDTLGPIPAVSQGERLAVEKVAFQAKQTKPPPRFTESALIKTMEKLRIGRPSTYAATIETLYRRAYTVLEKKAVVPTPLGLQVDELMVLGFESLTSHKYTARMEAELDRIAAGEQGWTSYLKTWWKDFEPQLARAKGVWQARIDDLRTKAAAGDRAAAAAAGIDLDAPACPECGARMKKRTGKSGAFWGCTSYPECKTAMPILAKGPAKGGQEARQIECPECGKPMTVRRSKTGEFLGCTGYPDCKGTAPIELTKKRYRKCPKCGRPMRKREGAPRTPQRGGGATKGDEACGTVKGTAKGAFWGCTGYPECKHAEDISKPARRPASRQRRGTRRPAGIPHDSSGTR